MPMHQAFVQTQFSYATQSEADLRASQLLNLTLMLCVTSCHEQGWVDSEG